MRSAPDIIIPAFQAISYLWGRADLDGEIWVADAKAKMLRDGSMPIISPLDRPFLKFYVRSTVSSVLRQLRDPHEDVVLWIDILCIDLQNDRETSLQLPKVLKIFNMANDVCL
jgi:hypothetical protein